MVHDEVTTRTPRERRHEENLRRILDAAMQMVERGGLEALSINQLAEAVDYTPGALYRYFGSKDALLSKLVTRVLEDVRLHLDAALALLPAKAPPLARVLVLVHGYRAFARKEPQRFGLLAVTLADPRVLLQKPDDAAPVVLTMMAAMQPLADALDAAALAGHLGEGDVAERTISIFALVQGLLQMSKQARHAPAVLDVERLVIEGTRALLLGWGAKANTHGGVNAAIDHVAALGDLTARLGDAP